MLHACKRDKWASLPSMRRVNKTRQANQSFYRGRVNDLQGRADRPLSSPRLPAGQYSLYDDLWSGRWNR